MMRRVVLVLAGLLPAACGEKVTNPKAAGSVVHVPAFEWRVMEPCDRAYRQEDGNFCRSNA